MSRFASFQPIAAFAGPHRSCARLKCRRSPRGTVLRRRCRDDALRRCRRASFPQPPPFPSVPAPPPASGPPLQPRRRSHHHAAVHDPSLAAAGVPPVVTTPLPERRPAARIDAARPRRSSPRAPSLYVRSAGTRHHPLHAAARPRAPDAAAHVRTTQCDPSTGRLRVSRCAEFQASARELFLIVRVRRVAPWPE